MHLTIIAVGQRMPDWVDSGFHEYAKRLPSDWHLTLREIKPETRNAQSKPEIAMAREAERIRAALPARARLIVLDERGRDLTSAGLAEQMQAWREQGDPLALVIGGADGLDAQIKSEASLALRLSSMTLPHGMVRVLLAEQIYRAWSILQNHPYHRA